MKYYPIFSILTNLKTKETMYGC